MGTLGFVGRRNGPTVEVEPILCKWLRPHQREGVQFLVECVCGLRDYDGAGCILADDMGLGKTLQAITLTYTLLRQYPFGQDPLKRVVVVCPTSLIGNWADEFRKWLGKRVRVAACDKDGNHSLKTARQFLRNDDIDVLVISYETFRMHVELFEDDPEKVDLLICDEAHRLKNNETLTSQSLNVLACRRRVLLSGTPMQNKLDEFYAMVDFYKSRNFGQNRALSTSFRASHRVWKRTWLYRKGGEVGYVLHSSLVHIINHSLTSPEPIKNTQVLNAQSFKRLWTNLS